MLFRRAASASKLWPTVSLVGVLAVQGCAGLLKLRRDRRGSVALMAAIAMPSLVMAGGIGIEVTHWTTVRLKLQRTADVAALAGAAEYTLASNARNAANAAANMAELNGAAGAATPATRTWNAVSQTLTDNLVTAQVAPGVQHSSNIGVKVTLTQTVPLALTRMMSFLSSVTISASGWAEVVANAQPCIVTLGSGASAIGVTAQGSPNLTATGCSVRSNASISTGGSASMTAAAFYANGSITSGIKGELHPNDGTIPDPYANNAAVQAAFAKLSTNGARSPFTNPPVPGKVYSSWTTNGAVILVPGIYYVDGPITLKAQASLTGVGVTIVTSGALTMDGGTTLTVSAPTIASAALTGAIPGVVFAGNSASASSFGGNTSPSLTGVVYLPNSDLSFGGTAQGGITGCLEVIANSVTLKGNASMASNCSAYGALTFSSDTSSSTTLVQ